MVQTTGLPSPDSSFLNPDHLNKPHIVGSLFCFSSFQEWSWEMISQLHLPCPLIYETKNKTKQNYLHQKFLLSREKGIPEGTSQQARDGFSGCLQQGKWFHF
jgi:hypothetical protein